MSEPWFKQVTLTDLKSNTSINEEIQKLSQPSMSQQRRLERKIGKKMYFTLILYNLILIFIFIYLH